MSGNVRDQQGCSRGAGLDGREVQPLSPRGCHVAVQPRVELAHLLLRPVAVEDLDRLVAFHHGLGDLVVPALDPQLDVVALIGQPLHGSHRDVRVLASGHLPSNADDEGVGVPVPLGVGVDLPQIGLVAALHDGELPVGVQLLEDRERVGVVDDDVVERLHVVDDLIVHPRREVGELPHRPRDRLVDALGVRSRHPELHRWSVGDVEVERRAGFDGEQQRHVLREWWHDPRRLQRHLVAPAHQSPRHADPVATVAGRLAEHPRVKVNPLSHQATATSYRAINRSMPSPSGTGITLGPSPRNEDTKVTVAVVGFCTTTL